MALAPVVSEGVFRGAGVVMSDEESVREQARLLAVATQGSGGDDENRLRVLLEPLGAHFEAFDQRSKRRSFFRLLGAIREQRPDLVVMEGTGIVGGLAVMLGRLLAGVPYVVSSGDAVGPFVRLYSRLAAPVFGLYERWLYRNAAGFIGWSPYLTGRALTFGVRRAMTAANWAFFEPDEAGRAEARARIRGELGIDGQALVVGIVGSLGWTPKTGYCYGLELVEAVRRMVPERGDLVVLIVGDGTGRAELEKRAGARLGRSVVLTGRVPRERVPEYLAAMDVASLPQSVDGVGSFRYTTKLSEYMAAGLPIVTSQIPASYDLDRGGLWRLPGASPWDGRFLDALAGLMQDLTAEAVEARRARVPRVLAEFDRGLQVERTRAFLEDLIAERRSKGGEKGGKARRERSGVRGGPSISSADGSTR